MKWTLSDKQELLRERYVKREEIEKTIFTWLPTQIDYTWYWLQKVNVTVRVYYDVNRRRTKFFEVYETK